MNGDPFALDSGLPNNFDGKITDARFEFDPEYQDGTVCLLKFTIESLDDEVADVDMKFSCGKGWEPAEKGRKAQREDGSERNFHKSSAVGLLISSMISAGAETEIKRRWNDGKGLGTKDAAFYEGLTFHWQSREIDYGGEIGKIDRLLPATYIEKKKGGEKKGKEKKGKVDFSPLDVIADESEDFEEFVERACDEYPELAEAAGDEKMQEIWNEACERA